MDSSKQNSTGKIRSFRSDFNSGEYSTIHVKTQSQEQLRSDIILNQERSIINQNIDQLKNLLSQKKELNRKNRLDLSPFKNNSPSFESKGYRTPNKQSFQKSKDGMSSLQNSRDTFSGGFQKKGGGQQLITEIKMKIKGSPSRFHERLAEGFFTKDIIKPETVSFYNDNLINNSKQINILVVQNQRLESEVQERNAVIQQLDNKVAELQEKLERVVSLGQRNQEKFHYILLSKDQEIKRVNSSAYNLKLAVVSSMDEFAAIYQNKLQHFKKKMNVKVNTLQQKLHRIHTQSLAKAQTKIKLQKLIFQSESPYRKTKNILEKSPSVKGDTFEQMEQKRHDIEKQMFQKEIQYQQNKYQETINMFKVKYDQLYAQFLQTQKKNQNLKTEISNLKEDQQTFIKQHEENQRRLEQERKQSQQKQVYFRKQLSLLKVQNDSLVTQRKMQNKKMVSTPKSQIDTKKSSNSSYLKINQDSISQSDSQKRDQEQSLKEEIQKKKREEQEKKKKQEEKKRKQEEEKIIEQKIRREAQEMRREEQRIKKERELREKQIQLQLKEKELQVQRKEFEQQAKIKEQYFEQLQHIKSLLKTVQQSTSNMNNPNSQKYDQASSELKKLSQSPRTPRNLKQLSKIQYLAKKQRKQKEIVKSKLTFLQRQLEHQKKKNNQLESLIQDTENKIFIQIRSKLEQQNIVQHNMSEDEESNIEEEQSPFNQMFQSLVRSKKSDLNCTQSIQWQNKVKSRLQSAIQKLQALQKKSSPRIIVTESLSQSQS